MRWCLGNSLAALSSAAELQHEQVILAAGYGLWRTPPESYPCRRNITRIRGAPQNQEEETPSFSSVLSVPSTDEA